MSEDPKVHHVPVYSLVPDEQISVQSSIGAEGEHVDIVDGFSFVSFNNLEELNTYTQKQRGKLDKRHCPWLKRKLKRRKKLLKAKKKGTEEVKNSNEEKGDPSISSEHSQESSSFNISGAFSSNDLDTYLNNNAHLNISYAIPKCKTTEEGVTRLGEDELLEDVKRAEPPVSFPNPVPSESQPSDTGSNGGSLPTGEMEPLSHDEIHYEEVNAIDILYPKEKYKYYYNKDLCKETKADGSNVFVRRAGKLVPLTSVFKSQRTSMTESKNKKTVELVYVYDGGKLLTLGGSLTKINPSNSDSVRARVILPIGVPPIVKGDAGQTKTKKVQAVEINEDLAKFALSALQNPESKDVKMPEEKTEAKPEIEEKPGSVVEKIETKVDEPKQTVKDKLKEPPKITKVIPTKRNILDIIAAKLAMSDDESEEKEEEIEENQPPRDGSLIVGADTKSEEEDTKENVVLKDEDEKSNKAESVKECMTQSDEEDSDIKKSKESDVKKTEIENEDDLRPRMNMDFDSNKTVEATKQETESSEHEKDTDTATKSKEFENKSFKLCSTGDSEYGDEKEVAGGKNKIRAGALNMPHKDSKTDSHRNETKNDERYKETPAASSRKDSVQAPSQNTGSASDSKSTREILDDGQKVKKLISVPEETEKIEACKSEHEIQSSKVASEQAKAEQPVCATEENDSKTRTFKKNMYRFPSLSREMKRLNMNFVNYTMEETTQDDHAADESKIKDACTHEHCLLGCICDTLSCRRRDPEHCGRVECMFECNCRDESWKHAVSGMGRTMNAVSIFNLDREQKEGLALREKDFKKTVIQTGTEVILVGAERKKRERRIPGRYRDSAVWMGGDLVDMDCTSVTAEPEVPPEPDYPSIPISEAHKYIKKFKLTVPWYDVKGISVWCMDHSCYDCKCLTEPNFYTEEVIEKVNVEKKVHKTPTALDSIEEALKQKTNASLGILSQHDYDSMLWEGRCVVVNINVNNTEAKRKYSWKLKEWYHPKGMHSARTCGYSKKNMVVETKHLTLTGLSSQESTPEQVVENVVRSLKDPRTKLFVPALADFSRSPEVTPSGEEKDLKPGNVSVPLVDLTASCVSNESVESNELNHGELHGPHENEASPEENAGVALKRKLSGSLDICDGQDADATPTLQPKKMQKSGICEVIEDRKTAQPNKDEIEVEVNKSALKQVKPTQKQDKFPYRKPVSLLEMMIAEEKRGELELDLTDNFPGNAMLVAEARFRKLINMNIIGVIGINKSGRCIIATVDSIESMRVMQRIHSMISNNNLDVGPNMREIFFPPPHTVSRPRFVMIRCDGNAKWEIVGVVQKKGPYVTTKSSEQKSKGKPGLPVPQVVDLEEEERQKEKAKEKPDIVILADSENNGEDTGEKEGGAWEGSLPLIASVHSASDSSIADLMDLKDTAVSISEALPTRTTKEDVSHQSRKSLVPLEGDKTPPTIEVEAGVQKKQMTIDTISLKKVKALPDLVPIREPSIDVPSKESIEKTSTDTPISPVGMKTIKINQTSNRIFGDYNIVVTSTPFVQSSRCSPLVNVTSASSSLCSPNPVISLPGSAEDSKISHTVTSSKDTSSSPLVVQVENPSSISEDEKLVSPLSTKKINLSSPTSSGSAMFRPRIQVTHGKGINPTLQPRMAATSTVNHRMLYIPVSSSGMSKMVLMPSGSSGPSQMLFMSPPNKTPSSGVVQEGSKMKMVIVPSAGDRGKMVILPSHSIDTNVTALPLAAASEKTVETEKKFILLPPSQGLNFAGSLDNKSVSIPSIPTNVPEVNLTENVVSNKLQGTSALPEVVEETAAQKPENSDDSDDVVVIGTASNTLTITRVKTSEPEVSQLAGISTAPSVMIVPSTTSVVSGGGTAQTTVVSSVSTISSTLPQISQAQDCDIIVPAGNKPPVKDCSKQLKETEDMVIVKTSLNENQLNALLQNTHKDMLKNAEYPLDGSDVTHMKKDVSGQSQDRKDKSDPIHKKEVAHDNKDKSLSQKCSSKTHSQTYLKNTSEVQELESRPVPIKKMGYHWSAVDLSLSFKSVKLEWLLGTIRKNVLVNIFRMSQKTQSPVTLSVKNGSSTSMLYGLARTGLSDNKQPLPILILGSIISAVLSSASTTDNMLFHGNAVKYFIREATGELSSYTYDATGEYLVKLASKKRGHCGEMIGIGEKVLLQKMRESNYVSENMLIQSPEKGNHPKKSQESSKKGNTATQDGAGCSCTASGDFICLGHSTPEMESKSTTQQKPVSQPQSPVVVTYSKGAKDDPLSPSKSLGVTSSTDSKSQNTVAEGELTTVESGVQSCKTLDSYELPIPSVSHSQTGTVISKMEAETSPRKPEESSSQQSAAVDAGKDTPQSMKDHVQRDDKTSATDPMAVKEKDEAHTVNQSTSNPGNEGRLTSSEADEAEDVDVDIEGESEQGSSMLMQLRQQVASQTITVKKMKGTYNTPGDIARRLLSVSETGRRTGIKRKTDLHDHKYERPCPRSKKKMHQNKPLPTVKGIAEQEPRPGPSGIKQPVKPKQSTPTVLVKKKDPLRIQKRFSEIEGIGDERSAVVHNELERMRRRLMGRLFKNLQYWALYTPEQSSAEVVPVPKVAVLSIATKVCKEVKEEEIRLTAQEEEVRAERSMLIKRLASTIADQGDDTKMYWKQWVKTNMKYPVARIVFEKNWKPSEVDKDAISISSTESSLDLDLDDGSPLSTPSSPHHSGESMFAALEAKTTSVTQTSQVRRKKIIRPGRKPDARVKKTVNVSQKLFLDSRLQGLNISSEAAGAIPTSILLMAGTSSRGRKIVRKEDVNFVPSCT
ncbi:uncharacterized protein LOC134785049 isoform X2 [Penaeus indicus]|uniref:uncharacterized protein LOC134785049 isoform X2 n=1 Tax=Penaeus indicus TaxID=29960 RepID=UPI00300C7AA2